LKKHQIDFQARKDTGLNILIRDDSESVISLPEGVRYTKSLDLNTYYINIAVQDAAA